MIARWVRDLIAADATIMAQLGTYEFTTGVPTRAIFATHTVPDSAHNPCIHILEAGGPNWGDRGHKGADTLVRINVRGDRDFDEALRELAWEVWELVERGDLEAYATADGYTVALCTADTPIPTADEDGLPVQLIQARVLAMQV